MNLTNRTQTTTSIFLPVWMQSCAKQTRDSSGWPQNSAVFRGKTGQIILEPPHLKQESSEEMVVLLIADIPHFSKKIRVLSQIISTCASDSPSNVTKSQSSKANFKSCIYIVKKESQKEWAIYSTRCFVKRNAKNPDICNFI